VLGMIVDIWFWHHWMILKRSITKCNRSIRNKNQCVTCEGVSTISHKQTKEKSLKKSY
jgi:hypothetical protein